MQAALAALGWADATLSPLAGGDLSDIRAITVPDGRRAVAKSGPLVAVEARMLRAMARAGAPVPAVLAEAPHLIVLEWLEETAPRPDAWADFGRALAALHAVAGPRYGWDEDYAFGPCPIDNHPRPDWPAFWAEARLLPFLPTLPAELARRVEALARTLPDLLPAAPPASLLHGDLWTGNALFSGARAHLIDPACYYGDAEVDLALLHLFGTPPAAFTDAYGPLRPGWQARRPLYQLWPALVHLRLFGGGYRGMVESLLRAAGS